MRLRNLAIMISVCIAEVAVIAILFPQWFGFLAIFVQIVTIAALVFPAYSYWARRGRKKWDLVEEVRIWADYFDLMTRFYFESPTPHPTQVTQENVKTIQALAEKTADHISEAIARGERHIGPDLSGPVKDFILGLTTFARNNQLHTNASQFLTDLENLRRVELKIRPGAEPELNRYRTRYGVPVKLWLRAGEVASLALGVLTTLLLVAIFLAWHH